MSKTISTHEITFTHAGFCHIAGLLGHWASAWVGIGTPTPDAAAALEVRAVNKDLLIPQVTLTTLTNGATIPTPATGFFVFNRNAALGSGVGFYYNAGSGTAPSRTRLNTGPAAAGSGWGLSGNATTDSIASTWAKLQSAARSWPAWPKACAGSVAMLPAAPAVCASFK